MRRDPGKEEFTFFGHWEIQTNVGLLDLPI